MNYTELNTKRLKNLDEILHLQYEKLFEFEKEVIITSSIAHKFELKKRINNEIIPSIKIYENEYADLLQQLLAREDIVEIENTNYILEELENAINGLHNTYKDTNAEIKTYLTKIKSIVESKERDTKTKLKLILPIIPLICSFEIELDTNKTIINLWKKIKSFLKVKNNVQLSS